MGISSLAEGLNILRLLVNVTLTNKTNIYSHENMTYQVGVDTYAPLYWFQYGLELDIMPLIMSEIYTIQISMEIYYPEVIE